ncbi:radical SAM protein [Candidatus Woesearchaeota archaeon]|nr:radical SAM protein [Candidatus Woesearchaeota archaeon]
MAKLSFETLSFKQEQDCLVITLLQHFQTKIPLEELNALSPFNIINPHTLEFTKLPQEKAQQKFLFLFEKYLPDLTTKLTGNKAIYIHKNSGIPLIGNIAFGIVYRNSSIIEIKPVTSCNLDCIYCSISEGLSSKKTDFVIEKDYLLEELNKLLYFINEPVEIHVGVQGEPFLYADMENLLNDLNKIKQITTISIDTNCTLLSKDILDRLSKNEKLQFNISLDALDETLAKKIAGAKTYNLNQVKEQISYAAEKFKVIVAPVLMTKINEQEMEKIILFIKSLNHQPTLGIQNFLIYKTGRNPAKSLPWPEFYTLLDQLEKKHHIKLKLSKEDFSIRKTKDLPKPFKEGDILTATLKCPDRFPNTCIAVAKNRDISIPNCMFQKEKKVKIKIGRDKHNIFTGNIIK